MNRHDHVTITIDETDEASNEWAKRRPCVNCRHGLFFHQAACTVVIETGKACGCTQMELRGRWLK